jgi:hypothetical protein
VIAEPTKPRPAVGKRPSNRIAESGVRGLRIDMSGAIVVSGIGQGELVSLTLAPALLVAMIYLLRCGTTAPVTSSRR